MSNLQDKIALVTGGASGIGLKLVDVLLCNGTSHVIIADLNEENGIKVEKDFNNKFGIGKVLFIKTDVSNEEQFEDAFKKTVQKFKKVDIVINNAGVFNEKKWQLCIDINAKAVVSGSYLALKYMGKNNQGLGGIVVNTASVLGLEPMSTLPVYTGTKHFVVGFTRSMGVPYQFNLTGVKFCAICPGVTETPLIAFPLGQLPDWPNAGNEFGRTLGTYPRQSVDYVGDTLIAILKEGENGSCWVTENEEKAYPAAFPDRKIMKPQ